MKIYNFRIIRCGNIAKKMLACPSGIYAVYLGMQKSFNGGKYQQSTVGESCGYL